MRKYASHVIPKSKLRTAVMLLLVCFFAGSVSADDPFRPQAKVESQYAYRSWTDNTGNNRVEARFVSATASVVTIQKRDGLVVRVSLTRLSALDRGYIEGIAAALSVTKIRLNTPQGRSSSSPSKSEPSPRAPVPVAKRAPAIKPYTGEEKEIPLPDTIGDVCRAAAGRLLLLHLPKSKKVAVYDVNEAKITKFISLSSDSAKIVGGLTKMIVVSPNDGVIERWSLETFKKETTRTLPIEGAFKTMAMGYATDGPLMIHWAASTDALARAQYQLFEIDNFKSLEYSVRGHNSSYRDAVHIRAAATGDVFGLWATSHSPQGMEVMRVLGDKVEVSYQHSSAGHLVPNFNGSAILSGYAGVCTPELNKKQTNQKRVPLVPSTHPKFYVGVPVDPGAQVNLGRKPFDGVAPTLHAIGGDSRLINMPQLKLGSTKDNPSWGRSNFSLDKRVHYIVAANQLVSVPFTNDKLILQPFDCRAELEKAGIDYLFVTSVAPRHIQPGEKLEYALEVATSGGRPRFELSSGPEGMEVDENGVVRWTVPANFKEQSVNAILTISTPDGQSVYETFKIENSRRQTTKPNADRRAARDTLRSTPNSSPTLPDRATPKRVASNAPADHGLEVRINPEGMYRPAVPDPTFSGGARVPVFRHTSTYGDRRSPAKARVRVFNRSKKTIDALTLAVTNDAPILIQRSVRVDALRGVGQLRPGEGVEFVVHWGILSNVRIGPGGATVNVTVTGISTK